MRDSAEDTEYSNKKIMSSLFFELLNDHRIEQVGLLERLGLVGDLAVGKRGEQRVRAALILWSSPTFTFTIKRKITLKDLIISSIFKIRLMMM